MARSIIIADVHGHHAPLCELLNLVSPTQADSVILIGDLIDRGPCSAEVIRLVQQEGYQALLGNHEDLLLQAAAEGPDSATWRLWLKMGGEATLSSFGNWSSLQENLPWIQQLPTHLDLGGTFLSHAGLDPRRSLDEQGTREFCWSRLEFLNYPQPYFPQKQIILGHTPTCRFPMVEPGLILAGPSWLNIETGVDSRRSGWLTALSLEDKQVFQVNRFWREQRVLDLDGCQQAHVPVELECLLIC